MTQTEYEALLWKKINIIKVDGNNTLIFIYDTEEQARIAFKIMRDNDFNIRVQLNDEDEFILLIYFEEKEGAIQFNTGFTKEKYPPLKWLQNG
ncbi:MAG: hypothetical protein ABUT20_57905, partial [Bacteroidota bacterium]